VCVCVFVSLFLMHGHSFEQFWRVASLYPPHGHRPVSERRSRP